MNKLIIAAALLSAGAAQASTSLNVSASDWSASSVWQGQDQQSTDPAGPVSLSANGGLSSAWGFIDATTGTIRLSAQAQTGSQSVWTGAWASASINDTITLDHVDPYVQVLLSLSFTFETTASYSYPAPAFIANSNAAKHYSTAGIGRVRTAFSLSGYDYGVETPDDETPYQWVSVGHYSQFDFDAGPYVALNHPSSHVSSEWVGDTHIQSYVLPNGQPGGFTLTEVLTLPTQSALDLSFSVDLSTVCSVMGSCDILLDGGNSFHLGLKPLQGSLVSANGYGYTYLAAPVPEPETYAMLLAGLGLIGVVARRRRKA